MNERRIEMRTINTNRNKKPEIIGVVMVFVGATVVLLNALLPYFYPMYFTPLPIGFVFFIVGFVLFCFGYGFMCISLRKVHMSINKEVRSSK